VVQFGGIFSNDFVSKDSQFPPQKALLYQLWEHIGGEKSPFADSKQLFSYIKQSAIIQFNEKLMDIYEVFNVRMLILRPELYTLDGTELYLVAIRNQKPDARDYSWQLEAVATEQEIRSMDKNDMFGKTLPFPEDIRKSLREQPKCAPNTPFHGLITWHPRTKLTVKMPQNLNCQNTQCRMCLQKKRCGQFKIGRNFNGKCDDPCDRCGCSAADHGLDMRYIGYLELSPQMILNELRAQWNDADLVPVVFNAKGSTQIEWKVFLTIREYNHEYSVVLSIRYNKNRGQWQLQNVVDCEPHRLWSQYLLLGPQSAKGKIGGQWRLWTEEDFKKRSKCIVKVVSKRR